MGNSGPAPERMPADGKTKGADWRRSEEETQINLVVVTPNEFGQPNNEFGQPRAKEETMKMVDMGRRENMGVPIAGAKETRVYYQSLNLNVDKLKGLATVKVDDVVEVVIKCKVTGTGRRTYGSKERFCAVDIHKAGIMGKDKTLKDLYQNAGE